MNKCRVEPSISRAACHSQSPVRVNHLTRSLNLLLACTLVIEGELNLRDGHPGRWDRYLAAESHNFIIRPRGKFATRVC